MDKEKTEVLSFDKIRALFAETRLQMQETDRRLDKLREENALQMKETGRKIDKLCVLVGGIDNNIGFHAEQFFQDIFAETLAFGGEKYDCMLPNLRYSDRDSGVGFDIVLANGKSAAIIKTKNRIHPDFVRELAGDKIVKFRKFFPHYQNHKVYLGIVGFSFNQAVTDKAKEYGMGIITGKWGRA